MKLFKQTVLVLTAILALNSCSSDDGESKRTNATISLKQAGEPAQGVTVYVYDEDTWSMIGDDPFFALGESVSDSNGKAKFSNLEYGLTFNDINNNQNTLTFSAHYTLEGVSKKKTASISFNKGESKSAELILN